MSISYQKVVSTLQQRLTEPLPGKKAHLKMMSYNRPNADQVLQSKKDVGEGAVLALLYPHENQVRTALMLRPTYDGVHSGQVSFPGGRKESTDDSLIATALRETKEEIGVGSDSIQVLGELTKVYIPPSNILVTPILGCTAFKPNFIPDRREVEAIIETPIEILLKEETIKKTKLSINERLRLDVRYFDIEGHVVWGATAMMLSEIRELLLD